MSSKGISGWSSNSDRYDRWRKFTIVIYDFLIDPRNGCGATAVISFPILQNITTLQGIITKYYELTDAVNVSMVRPGPKAAPKICSFPLWLCKRVGIIFFKTKRIVGDDIFPYCCRMSCDACSSPLCNDSVLCIASRIFFPPGCMHQWVTLCGLRPLLARALLVNWLKSSSSRSGM